jgi:hypothetical protein
MWCTHSIARYIAYSRFPTGKTIPNVSDWLEIIAIKLEIVNSELSSCVYHLDVKSMIDWVCLRILNSILDLSHDSSQRSPFGSSTLVSTFFCIELRAKRNHILDIFIQDIANVPCIIGRIHKALSNVLWPYTERQSVAIKEPSLILNTLTGMLYELSIFRRSHSKGVW